MQAEAQNSIVHSTVETIIIVTVLSYSFILLFTGGDFVIAFFTTLLVLASSISLVFFMLVVFGWLLGPIEIIFLVIFLGYSLTFNLHLSVNYAQVRADKPRLHEEEAFARTLNVCRRRSRGDGGEASIADEVEATEEVPNGGLQLSAKQLRKARTRHVVLQVGAALLSATASTIGSAIFLVVCSLQAFNRLGLVIIVVVSISLILTLVVLPAILLIFGPSENPCYKRLPRQAAFSLFKLITAPRKKVYLLDAQNSFLDSTISEPSD